MEFPDIPKAVSPPPIRTIHQLSSRDSWFENIAVRPSGEILICRADAPELWMSDAKTGASSVLVTFDASFRTLMGIAELTPDVWAVAVGYYDHDNGGATPGSWEIFKVDLTGSEPKTEHVVKLPDSAMINGMASWDETTVIVVDSMLGKIFRIDVAARTYSVALEDPATMSPPDGAPVPIGINGVRVRDGYVYYTNTMRLSLFRIPVDADLKPRGPAETVATGFAPDDFCFDPENEDVVYVTGNATNVVLKVTMSKDVSQPGTFETFVGDTVTMDVAGATACAFGRGSSDKRTLYIVTAGGSAWPVNGELVEGAKLVAVDV